ncbi:MAG: HypC/HybG/HupF family hydrogenase formation chaperone [Planctomycetia bacterium]|nr:HypC/HybG/HupF family hydrogenase formation chaperone [Planctomycetia bacterium]
MCLAVPGRLEEWTDRDPLLARGWVVFGGVRHECHLACVPEAEVGDYVLVHAGIALNRIDIVAAEKLLRELRDAGEESPPSAEDEML